MKTSANAGDNGFRCYALGWVNGEAGAPDYMRRFLMGSIVAAVVGLLLAGAGYWAYWNFYSRFQPVTISRNQAEVQQLLDEASWVSDGSGGQALYIVTYRDSASALRYARDEAPKLKAAGIETRYILFRPPRSGRRGAIDGGGAGDGRGAVADARLAALSTLDGDAGEQLDRRRRAAGGRQSGAHRRGRGRPPLQTNG